MISAVTGQCFIPPSERRLSLNSVSVSSIGRDLEMDIRPDIRPDIRQ
jgi:hypothetical protein